jgi:hypothetical protein
LYCEIENVLWISLEISFVRKVPTKQALSSTCFMMITIKITTSFKFHKLQTKRHANTTKGWAHLEAYNKSNKNVNSWQQVYNMHTKPKFKVFYN